MGNFLNFIALDLIHPPLFYFLLKGWMTIGGDGLLWLRLFPVLISLVAIVPLYKLCRDLKLDRIACLVGFFLIATNGALIKYAQEVRMYSLLMCLSLFSMWLFVRFANRGKGIVVLTIVNLLLVYSHYFGWFVIVSEVLVAAFVFRPTLKRIIISNAAIFILFIPWLAAVFSGSQHGSDVKQNIGWMSRPGLVELWQYALDLVEPFYQQMTSAEPGANYLIAMPTLALYGFVIVFAVVIGRVRFETSSASSPTHTAPPAFAILSIFAVVPMVFAFLASWVLPVSIWGTRHLIIVFAPTALLFGFCLSRIFLAVESESQRPRSAAIAAGVLLAAAGFIFVAMRSTPAYSWCAVDEETRRISTNAEPVTIYTVDHLTAYHAWFASRRRANVSVGVIRDFPGVREDNAYFLPRGFDSVSVVGGVETSGILILRSSTLADHRRGNQNFVINESSPVQYPRQHGISVTEPRRIPADGEDVYSFRFSVPAAR